MRNIRLTVAYDGTDFNGWQRQPNAPTIQGCIETAIAKITGEPVSLYGSGRTDAGVHALNQVANFKTECRIPCANLVDALNNFLPLAVRIKQAEEVPQSFHARYDVKSKSYRYRILLAPVASPFVVRFVYHYPYPLELKPMAAAARLLEGEHDFTSFAASGSDEDEKECRDARRRAAIGVRDLGFGVRKEGTSNLLRIPNPETRIPGSSMVRTIFSSRILWRPRTSVLAYQVKGSGFLHHMVRNIVGTLIEVGRGKLRPNDIPEILAARDRTRAGPTAPASGLCLMNVEYDDSRQDKREPRLAGR